MAHIEIHCTSCSWEGEMVEESFWSHKKDVGVNCPECSSECVKK